MSRTMHVQNYIYIYIYITHYIHTLTHTYLPPTYLPTYLQTDRQTDRQTDLPTDRQTYLPTDRQTDRHTYIHTDIQTYRHTYIQTDRQTYIHKCILFFHILSVLGGLFLTSPGWNQLVTCTTWHILRFESRLAECGRQQRPQVMVCSGSDIFCHQIIRWSGYTTSYHKLHHVIPCYPFFSSHGRPSWPLESVLEHGPRRGGAGLRHVAWSQQKWRISSFWVFQYFFVFFHPFVVKIKESEQHRRATCYWNPANLCQWFLLKSIVWRCLLSPSVPWPFVGGLRIL